MPNKNYLRGRAFEYRRKAFWKEKGWTVLRTAGSKGPYDLILLNEGTYEVRFLQLKRVKTPAEAKRMFEKFKEDKPSLAWSGDVRFGMEFYIQSTKETLTEWI